MFAMNIFMSNIKWMSLSDYTLGILTSNVQSVVIEYTLLLVLKVLIADILTRLMEGEQDFMSLIPCNYNSNKKVNVKAA